MSSVESRSIINAPIRRSFDALQNQTRDSLEELGTYVDEVAEKAADDHRKSAWGVVGLGSFPYNPRVTLYAGGVRGPLTNALSVTFVKDRYYEVRCVLRAIGAATDPDPAVIEANDLVAFYAICNVNGTDRSGTLYAQALNDWQGANLAWVLRCPADVAPGTSSVSILVTNARGVDVVIYTDPGSHFIIQDIGSTLP
jgi:hypothetical protein